MFDELLERLRANVESGLPGMCDAPMKVPASSHADPDHQYAVEIEKIFLRVPLLVALSCACAATLDLDGWPAGAGESLESLPLDELYPYRVPTTLDSTNWKLAAAGYLDGQHIGYLRRNTIERKAITNSNTYNFFGPHVRVGFATKQTRDETGPVDPARLAELMSLVRYIFPNVSISGGHGAIGDGHVLFGRNESGNQHLHDTIRAMTRPS